MTAKVLDVLEEVISWREMVLSGMRTPIVLSDIDDPSHVSLSIHSILAILFKSDEPEKDPIILSSMQQFRLSTQKRLLQCKKILFKGFFWF